MGEKVEKVRADFHKFLALLGLMTEHTATAIDGRC